MAIRTFYQTEDDAPEPLREHLVAAESGNGYVLDIENEDFRSHPLATGLKSALDKERQRANTAEKRAKEAGQLDEAAQAELDEWRRKGPELEERATQAEQRAQKLMIDGEIAAAVAEHGGNAKALPRIIAPDVGVDDEGVYIRGEDGAPLIDSEGGRVSVSQHVASMAKQKDYANLFASTLKAGAGTPPGDRTPAGTLPAEPRAPGPGSRPLTAIEKRNAERRARIDAYKEAHQQ